MRKRPKPCVWITGGRICRGGFHIFFAMRSLLPLRIFKQFSNSGLPAVEPRLVLEHGMVLIGVTLQSKCPKADLATNSQFSRNESILILIE